MTDVCNVKQLPHSEAVTSTQELSDRHRLHIDTVIINESETQRDNEH